MGRARFGAPAGVAYHAAGGEQDERSTLSTANTDGDDTRQVLSLSAEDSSTSTARQSSRPNTSMRGVEVNHVRRKDVDLEKVWDVERHG